jgi:predicted metal-dependent enzyme (double-stranded beta helix superfamily)
MASQSAVATRRARACKTLLDQVHAVTAREGINPSTLHAIKLKVMALARRSELFPLSDFTMPSAQGRNHALLVEDGDDGHGVYLSIGLPGKEAAPHDHGIWCASAALAGQEHHVLWRRTDDGREKGRATVAKVGEVMVEPGTGLVMADHDIHSTEIVGKQPAVILSVYGYALTRFPSVSWFHPEFGSMRTTPSRRHAA